MKIHHFLEKKLNQQKISMVTCYDYTFAQIVSASSIDCILVGDSANMVMHGHPTTLSISTQVMALHTAAVVRGAPNKFIVADLPFMSYRKGLSANMSNIEKVMKAGAHSVKLEGLEGNENLIRHTVQSGVPVMGHLGLTPQSIHQLGGFKVQGKEKIAQQKLLDQSLLMQDLGAFALVLECVPSLVAAEISKKLTIPVIGIGAGPDVDGQVLVLQDLLGMNNQFKPKFLKKYMDGFGQIKQALDSYHNEVIKIQFPEKEHSYEI